MSHFRPSAVVIAALVAGLPRLAESTFWRSRDQEGWGNHWSWSSYGDGWTGDGGGRVRDAYHWPDKASVNAWSASGWHARPKSWVEVKSDTHGRVGATTAAAPTATPTSKTRGATDAASARSHTMLCLRVSNASRTMGKCGLRTVSGSGSASDEHLSDGSAGAASRGGGGHSSLASTEVSSPGSWVVLEKLGKGNGSGAASTTTEGGTVPPSAISTPAAGATAAAVSPITAPEAPQPPEHVTRKPEAAAAATPAVWNNWWGERRRGAAKWVPKLPKPEVEREAATASLASPAGAGEAPPALSAEDTLARERNRIAAASAAKTAEPSEHGRQEPRTPEGGGGPGPGGRWRSNGRLSLQRAEPAMGKDAKMDEPPGLEKLKFPPGLPFRSASSRVPSLRASEDLSGSPAGSGSSPVEEGDEMDVDEGGHVRSASKTSIYNCAGGPPIARVEVKVAKAEGAETGMLSVYHLKAREEGAEAEKEETIRSAVAELRERAEACAAAKAEKGTSPNCSNNSPTTLYSPTSGASVKNRKKHQFMEKTQSGKKKPLVRESKDLQCDVDPVPTAAMTMTSNGDDAKNFDYHVHRVSHKRGQYIDEFVVPLSHLRLDDLLFSQEHARTKFRNEMRDVFVTAAEVYEAWWHNFSFRGGKERLFAEETEVEVGRSGSREAVDWVVRIPPIHVVPLYDGALENDWYRHNEEAVRRYKFPWVDPSFYAADAAASSSHDTQVSVSVSPAQPPQAQQRRPQRYVVISGNRRLAVFKAVQLQITHFLEQQLTAWQAQGQQRSAHTTRERQQLYKRAQSLASRLTVPAYVLNEKYMLSTREMFPHDNTRFDNKSGGRQIHLPEHVSIRPVPKFSQAFALRQNYEAVVAGFRRGHEENGLVGLIRNYLSLYYQLGVSMIMMPVEGLGGGVESRAAEAWPKGAGGDQPAEAAARPEKSAAALALRRSVAKARKQGPAGTKPKQEKQEEQLGKKDETVGKTASASSKQLSADAVEFVPTKSEPAEVGKKKSDFVENQKAEVAWKLNKEAKDFEPGRRWLQASGRAKEFQPGRQWQATEEAPTATAAGGGEGFYGQYGGWGWGGSYAGSFPVPAPYGAFTAVQVPIMPTGLFFPARERVKQMMEERHRKAAAEARQARDAGAKEGAKSGIHQKPSGRGQVASALEAFPNS